MWAAESFVFWQRRRIWSWRTQATREIVTSYDFRYFYVRIIIFDLEAFFCITWFLMKIFTNFKFFSLSVTPLIWWMLETQKIKEKIEPNSHVLSEIQFESIQKSIHGGRAALPSAKCLGGAPQHRASIGLNMQRAKTRFRDLSQRGEKVGLHHIIRRTRDG